MFQGNLQLFFRHFFDPAVEFVGRLENQVNRQKLVLQGSVSTHAAVPESVQEFSVQGSVPTHAAVPDDQQAAVPSLTVDKALSFLETYLSTADARDKVRVTARFVSIC